MIENWREELEQLGLQYIKWSAREINFLRELNGLMPVYVGQKSGEKYELILLFPLATRTYPMFALAALACSMGFSPRKDIKDIAVPYFEDLIQRKTEAHPH